MGRNQKLKKYKKEAQRTITAVVSQMIKPEPKSFASRIIHRLALRVVMAKKKT